MIPTLSFGSFLIWRMQCTRLHGQVSLTALMIIFHWGCLQGLMMDWSLLQRKSLHPFFRPGYYMTIGGRWVHLRVVILLTKNVKIYYVAIVSILPDSAYQADQWTQKFHCTEHLEKCRNEISSIVISAAAVRDIDHPDEANQNIKNLGTMCYFRIDADLCPDRVESEHIGYADQYRVTRDIPLPYTFDNRLLQDNTLQKMRSTMRGRMQQVTCTMGARSPNHHYSLQHSHFFSRQRLHYQSEKSNEHIHTMKEALLR